MEKREEKKLMRRRGRRHEIRRRGQAKKIEKSDLRGDLNVRFQPLPIRIRDTGSGVEPVNSILNSASF